MTRRNEWLRLATIGPHFLVSTLIGYAIGRQLDRWLDWAPILTVVFSLFGVAAGFLNLFREVRILNQADREKMENQDSSREQDDGEN